MKLLNKYKASFEKNQFDLDHEAKMVQSRILSTILEVIDDKNLTQAELEELTGLKQPFISAIFNNRKNLNMEHIALFQKALGIVLQPPQFLSNEEHKNKFYNESDYEDINKIILTPTCNYSKNEILQTYNISSSRRIWVVSNNEGINNFNSESWKEEAEKYSFCKEDM